MHIYQMNGLNAYMLCNPSLLGETESANHARVTEHRVYGSPLPSYAPAPYEDGTHYINENRPHYGWVPSL